MGIVDGEAGGVADVGGDEGVAFGAVQPGGVDL